MNTDKISEFIKKLRIENGYSQNSLSEKLHVTRQAISNWETGKAIPDSQILLELSKLFNVSINSILSGEITDNSLEEITLNLVDENNKKKTIIKKMFLFSTSIIASLIILFLGYYFFLNYNSIKVYRIKGESNKFKTYDGLLMTTRNKTYIRLNKIEPYIKTEEYSIKKIKLYYLDKKNKKIILYNKESDYISLENINGYNEFYVNKNKKYLIKNLYLEINYNDNKRDLIKLSTKKIFSNNIESLNDKEKSKVTRKKIKTDESNSKINELIESEITKTNLFDKVRHEIVTEDEPYIENETNQETIKQPVIEKSEIESSPELFQTEPTVIEESNETNNEIPIEETEELQKIDYTEIATLLKEKGTEEFGTYKYEYIDEFGRNIILSYGFNNIEVDIINNEVIETWMIFYAESKHISYVKFNNYVETVSVVYDIDYYDENLNLILLDFMEKVKSNL